MCDERSDTNCLWRIMQTVIDLICHNKHLITKLGMMENKRETFIWILFAFGFITGDPTTAFVSRMLCSSGNFAYYAELLNCIILYRTMLL